MSRISWKLRKLAVPGRKKEDNMEGSQDSNIYDLEKGIFIIADGLSGFNGRVSSHYAVETVYKNLETRLHEGLRDEEIEFMLIDSMQKAQERLLHLQGTRKLWHDDMGTTLDVAVSVGDRLHYAHIGDSALVGQRVDDTAVELTTRQEEPTTRVLADKEEEGIRFDDMEKRLLYLHKHYMPSHYIGERNFDAGNIQTGHVALKDYKRFLLATDGLLDYVGDSEMLSAMRLDDMDGTVKSLVANAEDPKAMVQAFIDRQDFIYENISPGSFDKGLLRKAITDFLSTYIIDDKINQLFRNTKMPTDDQQFKMILNGQIMKDDYVKGLFLQHLNNRLRRMDDLTLLVFEQGRDNSGEMPAPGFSDAIEPGTGIVDISNHPDYQEMKEEMEEKEKRIEFQVKTNEKLNDLKDRYYRQKLSIDKKHGELIRLTRPLLNNYKKQMRKLAELENDHRQLKVKYAEQQSEIERLRQLETVEAKIIKGSYTGIMKELESGLSSDTARKTAEVLSGRYRHEGKLVRRWDRRIEMLSELYSSKSVSIDEIEKEKIIEAIDKNRYFKRNYSGKIPVLKEIIRGNARKVPIKEEVSDLDARIRAYESEMECLKKELASKTEEAGNYQANITLLTEEKAGLEEQLASLSQEYEPRVQELEKELAKMRVSHSAEMKNEKKKALDDYRARVKGKVLGFIRRNNSEVRKAKKDLEEKREENEQYKVQVSSLSAKNEELEKRLESSEKRYKDEKDRTEKAVQEEAVSDYKASDEYKKDLEKAVAESDAEKVDRIKDLEKQITGYQDKYGKPQAPESRSRRFLRALKKKILPAALIAGLALFSGYKIASYKNSNEVKSLKSSYAQKFEQQNKEISRYQGMIDKAREQNRALMGQLEAYSRITKASPSAIDTERGIFTYNVEGEIADVSHSKGLWGLARYFGAKGKKDIKGFIRDVSKFNNLKFNDMDKDGIGPDRWKRSDLKGEKFRLNENIINKYHLSL